MIRYNVFLTERQIKKIKSEAKKLGVKPAELIRRILDLHISELERDTEYDKTIRIADARSRARSESKIAEYNAMIGQSLKKQEKKR